MPYVETENMLEAIRQHLDKLISQLGTDVWTFAGAAPLGPAQRTCRLLG